MAGILARALLVLSLSIAIGSTGLNSKAMAVSNNVIKIGGPTPMTGPYASDGIRYFRGIEMAAMEINKSGGLLGRPLKVLNFDTQDFAPETIMRGADKLIGVEKVHSIHAGWAGWGQDVRAYGKYDVPTFVLDASDASIRVYRENPKKYSNFFNMCDGERAHAEQMWLAMEKLPYRFPNKKVAIVNADDAWGRGAGDGIEEFAKKSGWEVVMHEVVPYGNREWRPILAKIRTANPAYLHFEVTSTPDMITFFRQFIKSPTKSILNFGYGTSFLDFIENMGNEINGLFGMSAGLPFPVAPTPESNAWLERYRKEYKGEPSCSTWFTYNGVMFWAEAVRKIGDVKKYSAINQYIESTPFKHIGGNVWKFNKDHFLPFSPEFPCLHFQVQDGRLVTVYTAPGKKYRDYEFQVPPWVKE